MKVKDVCLVTTAVILLVGGISLIATNSDIFSEIVRTQLVLSPTSASFPMWQDLPEPALTSMYLFNVTNAADVLAGAKPKLQEVGPYVFSEQHHKTKLVWNHNGTVTYQQVRTYHFMPEMTKLSLDDKVTIVNSIAATLNSFAKHNKIVKELHLGLSLWLAAVNEELFVTKTVREIIFEGYKDPVLDWATFFQNKFKIKIDGLMDKFGFFYGRNGSDWVDGVFNMFTGSTTSKRTGKVWSWNFSTENFFPDSCGTVKGGAGEFYPPGLEKTYIELFSNDLCRSLKFNYNREVSARGIQTYEFKGDKTLFANGTENKENACFNPPDATLPSGLFNVSACRFDAPVYTSFPHFYLADPSYIANIGSGIHPETAKHETYLRVEPHSGVPIDVTARFQVNVLVEPVPHVTLFENLRRTFIPAMWFETKAGVPGSLNLEMKMLSLLPDIVAVSGWCMIGVSVSIVIITAMCQVFKARPVEDVGPILSQSLVEDQSETLTDNTEVEFVPADTRSASNSIEV